MDPEVPDPLDRLNQALSRPSETHQEGESDGEAAYERAYEQLRRDARVAAGFAGLVGVWLLWWLIVNLYVLGNSVPGPLSLSIESGSFLAEAYDASVAWTDRPGPNAPVLFVDGRPIPEVNGSSAPPRLAVGRSYPTELVIDWSTDAGTYAGFVILTRSGGSERAPETIRLPVTVEVVRGPLSASWATFRWAALTALLVGTFLYAGMVLLFPGPSGRLFIGSGSEVEGARLVTLGVSMRGWLFPWSRSTLSLARVLRRAGVVPVGRVSGQIVFGRWRNIPPRIMLRPPHSLQRAAGHGDGGLGTSRSARFLSSGRSSFLEPESVFRIGRNGSDPPSEIRIRYRPPRSLH